MNVLELEDLIFDTFNTCCPNRDSNWFQSDDLLARDVEYSQFYNTYLVRNRPCLIREISNTWEAQKKWTQEGEPNFDFLEENYGSCEVPVSNCAEKYFNAHSKCTMPLSEYISYWKEYRSNNHPDDLPCLYLKDWHFVNDFPKERMYRVPRIFASDWLNEYCLKSKQDNDDYRFVYFGPKGSWTPLHADVFSSFSWSVNLCGKKKWVFYPPEQEEVLKDRFGNLPHNIEEFNAQKYPNHSKLTPITFIQDVGDAIFVPSNWYHQVWNLDDTISINHNWVNACNINLMWAALNKTHAKAEKEISDCRSMVDWDSRSQLMLKICFGMDHNDFADFIFYIAEERLKHVSKGSYLPVMDNWIVGANQMIYDLLKIAPVLEEMISTAPLKFLRDKIIELLDEISSICDI